MTEVQYPFQSVRISGHRYFSGSLEYRFSLLFESPKPLQPILCWNDLHGMLNAYSSQLVMLAGPDAGAHLL